MIFCSHLFGCILLEACERVLSITSDLIEMQLESELVTIMPSCCGINLRASIIFLS